jgi:hypothetical protein
MYQMFLTTYLPLNYVQVLNHRMQLGRHPSSWAAFQYILEEHKGIAAVTNALFGSGKLVSQIARDVPYSVIVSLCYELLQHFVNERKLLILNTRSTNDPLIFVQEPVKSAEDIIITNGSSQYQNAFCGSVAGGVGAFLTTPMDVVKTRLMCGGSKYQYSSLSDAIVGIWTEEGPQALFVGLTSRLLHKVPANAFFYVFYETFRAALGVKEVY